MEDLGTLGGSYSSARGINDKGQVTGSSNISGDDYQHAFFWTAAGGMQDLGTLGGNYSWAACINKSGQVVASSYPSGDENQRAFLWSKKGGMRDLGTLGGSSSYAYAINDKGKVVGQAQTAAGNWHAFLWSGAMKDLGTLGGDWSRSEMINNFGMVVGGSSITNEQSHAFAWTSKGGMVNLSGPDWNHSREPRVNNWGQVVGHFHGPPDNNCRAFFWTAQTGGLDLTSLVVDLPGGVILNDAPDINDRGEILARGSNGRSYILVPKKLRPSLGGVPKGQGGD